MMVRSVGESGGGIAIQYLPGYEIERAVGIITAEVVLGPGWWGEVSAQWAGFLGTRSAEFEAKWREAKHIVLILRGRMRCCDWG